MAICGPALVPHSHFLGGPLVWTDLDRDKQRAWARRQAETHSACGVHPDVWDHERGGDLGNLHMGSRFCAACEYLAAQARQQENRMPGQYFVWDVPPAEGSDGRVEQHPDQEHPDQHPDNGDEGRDAPAGL